MEAISWDGLDSSSLVERSNVTCSTSSSNLARGPSGRMKRAASGCNVLGNVLESHGQKLELS